MSAYFSDGPKRLLEQSVEEVDNISLDLKAIIESISNIRENLLEVGITTDQGVGGGILMLQALDGQIDLYLKQLFDLRVALNLYKDAA